MSNNKTLIIEPVANGWIVRPRTDSANLCAVIEDIFVYQTISQIQDALPKLLGSEVSETYFYLYSTLTKSPLKENTDTCSFNSVDTPKLASRYVTEELAAQAAISANCKMWEVKKYYAKIQK